MACSQVGGSFQTQALHRRDRRGIRLSQNAKKTMEPPGACQSGNRRQQVKSKINIDRRHHLEQAWLRQMVKFSEYFSSFSFFFPPLLSVSLSFFARFAPLAPFPPAVILWRWFTLIYNRSMRRGKRNISTAATLIAFKKFII